MSGTSNGAALTYQLLINTGADRPFHRCEYIDTNMSLTRNGRVRIAWVSFIS